MIWSKIVQGIPGSENEGWGVKEEKLRKVIKELDIEYVVIEQVHRVKRNSDNNDQYWPK